MSDIQIVCCFFLGVCGFAGLCAWATPYIGSDDPLHRIIANSPIIALVGFVIAGALGVFG